MASKGPLANLAKIPQIYSFLKNAERQQSKEWSILEECAQTHYSITLQKPEWFAELRNIFVKDKYINRYIAELSQCFDLSIIVDLDKSNEITLSWESASFEERTSLGRQLQIITRTNIAKRLIVELLEKESFRANLLINLYTGDYMYVYEKFNFTIMPFTDFEDDSISIDLPEYGFDSIKCHGGNITFKWSKSLLIV